MALYALGGVAFTAVFFIRKASFSKWKMVEYDAKTGDVHKCKNFLGLTTTRVCGLYLYLVHFPISVCTGDSLFV